MLIKMLADARRVRGSGPDPARRFIFFQLQFEGRLPHYCVRTEVPGMLVYFVDRRTDEVAGDSCHARTATRRGALGTGRRRHRDQVAWRADGRHRPAADGARRSAQVRHARACRHSRRSCSSFTISPVRWLRRPMRSAQPRSFPAPRKRFSRSRRSKRRKRREEDDAAEPAVEMDEGVAALRLDVFGMCAVAGRSSLSMRSVQRRRSSPASGRTGFRRGSTRCVRYHEGTFQHCLLVTGVAVAFGLDVGFSGGDVSRLGIAATLHDIGRRASRCRSWTSRDASTPRKRRSSGVIPRSDMIC